MCAHLRTEIIKGKRKGNSKLIQFWNENSVGCFKTTTEIIPQRSNNTTKIVSVVKRKLNSVPNFRLGSRFRYVLDIDCRGFPFVIGIWSLCVANINANRNHKCQSQMNKWLQHFYAFVREFSAGCRSSGQIVSTWSR